MLQDKIEAPPLGDLDIRRVREQIAHLERSLLVLKRSLSPVDERRSSAAPALGSVKIEEQMILRVVRARRMREKFFAAELFADPAWDILLEAFIAELGERRISVSSLCLASSVPPTTALRWVQKLERDGLLERRADPFDGRRYFVELSAETSINLRNYFNEAASSLPI